MKHEQYLTQLLQPLGVYNLDRGSINRGELAAYGVQLDRCLEELEHAIGEMNLLTARDSGLEAVESLLPYHPASESPEMLGKALAALLRIGGDSFTVAAINDTLAGCGASAVALEGEQPGYVEILFPEIRGIPDSFERMQKILEEILPCHLEITYRFWYNNWGDLSRAFSAWGNPALAGKSWYDLAILKI